MISSGTEKGVQTTQFKMGDMKMKRSWVCVTVVVLAVLFGTGTFLKEMAFAQERGKDKAAVAAIKWEYKIITMSKNMTDAEQALNKLGQDGWECAGTTSEVTGGGQGPPNMTTVRLIFKRPKQ